MADDQDVVRSVPLASLRRYLLLHGWRAVTSDQRAFDLFLNSQPRSPDIEIALPKLVASPETLRSVLFAVRSLSQLEERTVESVIADIRAVSADIIRSTVPDALVKIESISLDVAAEFVNGVKRLLTASATTEINPGRFFGRARKEAQEYSDRCRFAHTFRGSFGFTVESPIVPNVEPEYPIVEQVPPFERRVIQRIVRGLDTLESAAVQADPSVVSMNYAKGLSANMCDDVADLVEAIPGQTIRVQVRLSPEWKPPVDIVATRDFELGTRHVEIAREASKELRQQEIDRHHQIVGRVVRLKSQDDPSDLLNPVGVREITVEAVVGELGEISVRILLPPAEYLAAVEAHKQGRAVGVTGVLERIGRRWNLINPVNFTVI